MKRVFPVSQAIVFGALLLASIFAGGTVLAQASNAGASASVEKTSRFNSANPSGATINANGQAIGEDARVIQRPNGSPTYSLKNLAGGTSLNPYTGVAVGQPLQANDLGR
jgi:hypothetical protein